MSNPLISYLYNTDEEVWREEDSPSHDRTDVFL